ncbi:MAG: glycosyltransferase [Acidithiobacillus sp.]|nr:glycosyltransferase [Acidithiobacillus sp.]
MKRTGVNIVGRMDDNTGIAQLSKSFIDCLKGDFNINFINTRPELSGRRFLQVGVNEFHVCDDNLNKSDVSIFVDVTADNCHDTNWQKTPKTKRKYIYSVFDSTRIPVLWSDIINNNFDAVFVPARFLIDVYRESNVQKPIFYLPLALDLDAYMSIQTKYRSDRPFVFAFVGAREKRKNVEVLLECFNDVFGDRSDVILRLHCALDFYNDTNYGSKVMSRYRNVLYTQGILDEADYLELINTSDCFVSLSKGEGYSIVPRQFLAAGKPVILSNCFAHVEILDELDALGDNLGFAVDASIPVLGYYDHICGGGVFGLQYDVYKPSVCDVLLKVFESRHSLCDKEQVLLRKEWAARYTQKNLMDTYKSIIVPAFCRMSTGNELEFGGITTADANLASRITGKNFSLSGWQDLSAMGKKIVVIGNDGGFFSVFNRFVSYLTWTLSEHPDSIVLPDWRIDSMQRHWDTKKFMSFCYGKPTDGNIWLKIFEPLPYFGVSEDAYNTDEDLYRGAILKDDYNEEKEPWLTYIHAYKLYRSPGFSRWRHWYNLYFSTYVRLRDHIQSKINSIYADNLKGYHVISVHIRHPSHGLEQPGTRMPTVDLYCDLIREIQGREGFDKFNSRIFLATDQESVVMQLKEQFGGMVVYSSDAVRTTKANDEHFKNLSPDRQMQEGFQIQHLTASNPDLWTTSMAEDVIIDAYLLAKGEYFVHVTSNIATAVAYLNPRIKMIYCE